MKQGMKQEMKMRLRIIIGLGVSALVLGSCQEKEIIYRTEKPKPATISSVKESNEGSNKAVSTASKGQIKSSSTVSLAEGTINSTDSTKDQKSKISDLSLKISDLSSKISNLSSGTSNSPKGEAADIWTSGDGQSYEPEKFAGGDGTKEDPYQIATAGHLDLVRWNLKKHFIVIKDLDLRAIANFEPIGDREKIYRTYKYKYFKGTFDGNGKKIKNLRINRPTESEIGLFGVMNGRSIVKNVKLEDANVRGNENVGGLVGYNQGGKIENSQAAGSVFGRGDRVGGLVGYIPNSSGKTTIENSQASVSVEGNDYVGGLVGYSYNANIKNSHATGNVFGENYVGGLVGQGSASNSYATGTVTGNDEVGGLVGRISSGTIENSYATGTVTGNEKVGGLVGYNNNEGTIQNSYATGTVTGNEKVGGLVGRISSGTIENSYATGTVTGNEKVGGLVGYNNNEGTITNSYATGTVTGNYNVGGLVGYNNRSISGKNYWKTGATGKGVGDGNRANVESKTDSELRALTSGDTSWDPKIWKFEEGKYPKFKWQK